MNFDKIPKLGTTTTRKEFWDEALKTVLGQKKVAGKNVSVNEQQGYGSIISINPQRGGSGSGSGSGCHGVSTLVVSSSFNYDDTVHVFSGFVSTDPIDISDCSGSGGGITLVTVTEAGIPCVPDAEVGIAAIAIYDSMSGLWAVTAQVLMEDHATVCGPTAWPPVSLFGDYADNITSGGGTFALVPGNAFGINGTVTFTFS